MRCVQAICETFNYKAGEVFELSAVDFLLYLNFINMDRREQELRQREELARIRAGR